MQDEPIQLTKAANGWIVMLPMRYMRMHGPEINWLDPQTIKAVAGMMKKEYAKDPTLEELGHYDEEQVPLAPMPMPQREPENNVYIFKTYDEASNFIKERYDK